MKKAFTLAEVLITLGIIGIIAALTMPALVVSYQKQQTVTQLKKVYTILNQAAKLAGVDYGDVEIEDWSLEATTAWFEQYFLPYVKAVKFCSPVTDCGFNMSSYKMLDGNAMLGFNDANTVGAMLPDGSIFMRSRYSATDAPMLVDLNGKKGPNVLGKDVFRFVTYSSQGIMLHSQGQSRDYLTGNAPEADFGRRCASGGAGFYCGALIMHDGWEIAPDYPW